METYTETNTLSKFKKMEFNTFSYYCQIKPDHGSMGGGGGRGVCYYLVEVFSLKICALLCKMLLNFLT